MPRVASNGLELDCEERGQGPPLVLICGLGMQRVAWPEAFLAGLAARGFRVITFDNRDVGSSTRLDALEAPRPGRLLVRRLLGRPLRAPYSIFDMAADTAGLLDALGIARAHVVGASMGGLVAQALAIAHGPRLASLVSMMSYSGGHLFTGRLRATTNLLRSPGGTREGVVAAQLRFFRDAGSTGFRRDDVDLARRVGLAYDRGFHPRGFLRQFAAALSIGDLRPRLATVTTPTLVLHGTDDGIFRPALGRETADAIPGATFRLVPGWGHDLAEGAIELLVDAIAAHARGHAAA